MSTMNKILEAFSATGGQKPLVVRSPGRVNLLGEHTDYNEGFVLPAAIDMAIYLALTPRSDSVCAIESVDMHDAHQFTLTTITQSPKRWPNYLMGVVEQLLKRGARIGGFNCVFGGDIPIGAGLSSSAALEAGLAYGLNELFSLGIDRLDLVRLSQKAENEFVGVQCGIMDQYVNIFGETGNVLRIDCRSLTHSLFPFDYPDASIVLFDTHVTHALAGSEYNIRRTECHDGVELIRQNHPAIRSLRDVTPEMLEDSRSLLTPLLYDRCNYVVHEHQRMSLACSALTGKDLAAFGELMYKTHEGLRDLYNVSCEELDVLVDIASTEAGVFGARMMGGGFGGCTINIVDNGAIPELKERITREYSRRFSKIPSMYVTSIGTGTSIIPLNENAND